MPRFCGVACRMAAYRRRRQKLSEKTPRWDGPRGRLRLSRLQAFDREQIAQRDWERKRVRQRRSQTQPPTRPVAERERPPTTAELNAMTDEQLQAMVPKKPEPLPDDWMFRTKPN
jgi:hypothetical protein